MKEHPLVSFLDQDPVEEDMGLRVEDMTSDQLAVYFKEQMKAINDIDVSLGLVDFAIMKNFLVGKYRQPNAGRILKWLFFRHKGKVTIHGERQVASTRIFVEKLKWMIDKLNVEMQMAVAREERKRVAPASKGFASIEDL
jgi:hypothetical protein